MMEQLIIIIVIPLLVAVLSGAIVSLLGDKTWGLIVAIVVCVIGMAVAVLYLKTSNDEEKQYEKFSIPPLEYKMSYDMTRADILKLWENKNETLWESRYKNHICIEKYWVSLYGIFGCVFEDQKLIRFYWTRVKQKQDGKYVYDLYEEEKESIVKSLETYYGEKEIFKEKGNYYWEQENCVITLTAEENETLGKYYAVCWYEPNYFYEKFHLEKDEEET